MIKGNPPIEIPGMNVGALATLTVPVIEDAVVERKATDMLRFVTSIRKALDEGRKDLGSPHREKIRAIDARFKPWLDRAAEIEAALKGALLSWRQKERDRIEAETRAIEEQARRALAAAQAAEERARVAAVDEGLDPDEADAVAAAVREAEERAIVPVAKETFTKTRTADFGSTTIARRWTYRVVDELAVPRFYLTPDHKAIMQAIKDGKREIAGLEIYQDETIRSGGA